MINIIKSKLKLKVSSADAAEYDKCVQDLANSEILHTMQKFIQHGNITCLEHSVYVSYISFRICKSSQVHISV